MNESQTPVFNVTNINGNLTIACNVSFVASLSECLNKILTDKAPKSLLEFAANLHKQGTSFSRTQDDIQIVYVTNISGSFTIACNGPFAKLLLDYMDVSLPEDTHKSLHAFVSKLDRQINYKEYVTEAA